MSKKEWKDSDSDALISKIILGTDEELAEFLRKKVEEMDGKTRPTLRLVVNNRKKV